MVEPAGDALQFYQLEMHLDPEWRMNPNAQDAWLGDVTDEAGETVISFFELAEIHWQYARSLANSVVKSHNAMVTKTLRERRKA